MEHDPETPQYTTGDKTSFAYITARDRWPVIITSAIDDVYRSVSQTDGAKLEEGKQIVRELTAMKYELQHDREMGPLRDDGQPDIVLYNKELEKLKNPTWHNVPWLYAECYFYRRIQNSFALSTHWKSYDAFSRQKLSTFRSSRAAVLELAAHYKLLLSQLSAHASSPDPKAEELLFLEICEICLWGNATDLSLLTSLSYDDIQKLQDSSARKESEQNILANDLLKVYRDVLLPAKEAGGWKDIKERRVDIVLDNAGFELFVDLVLAGYLLESGLATTVVLHPKLIPWFVSDVIPADFASLLSALAAPKPFYETPSEEEKLRNDSKAPDPLSLKDIEDLGFFFQNLASHHAEGKLILRPHVFWTHGGSFWRMPAEAPDLLEDLKGGVLSVWKGDLNYRKLTADAAWDPTTPFATAIGPLGPGSGINVLALRTCKADVVVGLKPGDDERLKAMEGGSDPETGKQRMWAWNGKWALCSFSDGNSSDDSK